MSKDQTPWKLVTLSPEHEIDVPMDKTGFYTVIHRQEERVSHKQYNNVIIGVRIDIMHHPLHLPMISFVSSNMEVLRKKVIQWISHQTTDLSLQHAGYIGQELQRAFTTPNFIQK